MASGFGPEGPSLAQRHKSQQYWLAAGAGMFSLPFQRPKDSFPQRAGLALAKNAQEAQLLPPSGVMTPN
jgi:hypothetical protein